MIPELGHFSLILAMCLALATGLASLVGAQRGDAALLAFARPAARVMFLCVALAFGALMYAFIVSDFSVEYVASNSNSRLPLAYRATAVWGGHEGSLLLWVLLLTLWTAAVTVFSRRLPQDLVARVVGILGLVTAGFLSFLLFTSNPFDRLLPPPADGRDLNPLLQDPGMILHPPLLYMGYVGFSVAFAFALGALLSGRLDSSWARWSRPWTAVAWLFLTLGIALGSFWAYYELGWGGWWFWDPVENASFMPWLVGTALLHSLAVTEKRDTFRNWTVLLAILAFSLSLLGTFLVRSGVLTSVHAFANDPRRGIYILFLLALVVGASLAIYAWRAPAMSSKVRFDVVSRESLLLINNVLLTVLAATVLLGTLYPLVLDALGLGKISVGPPYFESVFVPLAAPLVALMAVGPFARWKRDTPGSLGARLGVALALSVVAGVGLTWVSSSPFSPMVALGMVLAMWVVLASLRHLAQRVAGEGSLLTRLGQIPRAYWGMWLAHIGVAIFIIGVTLVKGLESNADVRMRVGDTTVLAGYSFRLAGLEDVTGPNYKATRGRVELSRQQGSVGTLLPEKRIYSAQGMPMTESAIDRSITRDVYVALSEPLGDGAWMVRVQVKPFVNWIWIGCLIMALGGLLAAADRRYRMAARTPEGSGPRGAPEEGVERGQGEVVAPVGATGGA